MKSASAMVQLLAPAKINLHLRVGRPRADGFHPLVTWMVTVGLFDTLEIESRPGHGMAFSCDSPEVPSDSGNLVLRAATGLVEAQRLRREGRGAADGAMAGAIPPAYGLSVRLHKRIPVGAGLGGGSSDGAHILMALNRLWNLNWSREELSALAAQYGSDLSFFFYAPSAICRGRGEVVRPIERPKVKWVVLVMPPYGISSGLAYRRFDEMECWRQTSLDAEPPWTEWIARPARELLPELVNDLEAPAFSLEPRLGKLRADVEQAVGRTVRMSGSGSTLFTLFDDKTEACAAAEQVMQNHQVQALAAELGV